MNLSIQLGKYKHYKGNLYEVIGVAKHSEGLESMVVYRALYQDKADNLWVRSLKMFTGKVSIDGLEVPRFEFLEE